MLTVSTQAGFMTQADTDFESLQDSGMQKIVTGGERYKDLYVRLKMAGYGDLPVST